MFALNRKGNRAFTLIELLVVIAIIALLTGIVLAFLNQARVKGRDASKIRTFQEVKNALNLFYSDNGYYPDSFSLSTLVPKYVSILSSDIKYAGLSCAGSKCSSYHIGIILELTNNPILNTDADSTDGFAGASADCGATAGSIDNCYDYSSLDSGSAAGLTWQRYAHGAWATANTNCNNLPPAGTWKLPTVNQLIAGLNDQYISGNNHGFTQAWFWSSTPDAGDPSKVVLVIYSAGIATSSGLMTSGYEYSCVK